MPYERSAQRIDQANGYKPKTMLTRMGDITFEVPQVRSSGVYPSALERGSRSEQSMNLALAEMYVQGVSTRLRLTVLQKLVGPEISISSTQISRCAQKLDAGLQACKLGVPAHWMKRLTCCSMPVMNVYVRVTKWWTALCW